MTTNTSGTLLLFWDYDTQWGADRSRLPGGPKNWGHLEFEHTERLLELHGQYDIPACFAVVGAAALPGSRPYSDPDQIRRIHAAGHEIASHTHRHEWLPGLNLEELTETLRSSKTALEQCLGAEVTSFVPPHNQPFDYPAGLSFSMAERRQAGPDRSDLLRVCNALRICGYSFCRVAYRSLYRRLAEKIMAKPLSRPDRLCRIAGITCSRVHTCGFGSEALCLLQRCAATGGFVTIYGHPHSLKSGGPQDESQLLPFFQKVCELRSQGLIRICLPKDLTKKTIQNDREELQTSRES